MEKNKQFHLILSPSINNLTDNRKLNNKFFNPKNEQRKKLNISRGITRSHQNSFSVIPQKIKEETNFQ